MGQIEIIKEMVFNAIHEFNDEMPERNRLVTSTDTHLYGKTGSLDSLGLVRLIVSLEQKIEDYYGVPITLADEKAMSQKTNPFRTVASLIDYIDLVLKETMNE